jgi:hypothetical protein
MKRNLPRERVFAINKTAFRVKYRGSCRMQIRIRCKKPLVEVHLTLKLTRSNAFGSFFSCQYSSVQKRQQHRIPIKINYRIPSIE